VQLCAVPALKAVGGYRSPCVPSLGAGNPGSCSLSLGTNAASLAGRTLRAEHPGPRAESGRSPALAMFSSKPVLQQRDSLTDNQRATRRAQASGFPKTQSREVKWEASKFQKVPRLRELRITYVFKRSCAPFVARNLVFAAFAAAHSSIPQMRGCNEARPNRNWEEQGFQLQRPSGRERENPRSERSEPAALKVLLCAGAGFWLLLAGGQSFS